MNDAMITSLGAVAVALIALIGTVYSSKKTAEKAANSAAERVGTLTVYRIDQLEKKVDKHNTLIDRMYCAEKQLGVLDEKVKVANHRLDDLEKEE
jgi:predicted nucleic acid-binding protein